MKFSLVAGAAAGLLASSVSARSAHSGGHHHHLGASKRSPIAFGNEDVHTRSEFSKRGTKASAHLNRRAEKTTEQQPKEEDLADGTLTAKDGCSTWALPEKGDTCISTAGITEGLTLNDFFEWNPSLHEDCQALQIHLWYCIDNGGDFKKNGGEAKKDKKPDSKKQAAVHKANAQPAQHNDDQHNDQQQQQQQDQGNSQNNNNQGTWNPGNSGNNGQDASQSGLPGDSLINGFHGLLKMDDQTCGPSLAAHDVSSTTGPNGAIQWMNCGIQSGGWTPPDVTVDMVQYKGLDELWDSDVFAPCTDYFHLFNQYGAANNLPPVFIASIAMQESDCRPNATPPNGASFGLMQITADKCGDAPGGNCYDPDYNVRTGAEYLRHTIDMHDGNVLRGLGAYNGWTMDMTQQSATAAANEGCCECQNNLDYLHGILNCLSQGIDNSQCLLYNNLAQCG